MKVAFAIEHFDAKQGGAEHYAWQLGQWLVAQGHTLDIFAERVSGDTSFARRTRVIGTSPHTRARPLEMAARLHRELATETYDIVQGFNHIWPCDVLRLGGGVHRAFEEFNRLSLPNRFARTFRRWTAAWLPRDRVLRENERRQFDDPKRQFIAVSRKVSDDILRYYPHAAGRIHLIYNGVDIHRFSPESRAAVRTDARARLGIPADGIALLFVSNNWRLKGLHDLLAAFAALDDPSLWLILAGRGHAEHFYSFNRAPARVRIAPPDADILSAYAAADALAHPSYYDAFGFVVLEAAACGLPLLVSRNCGAAELMNNQPGAVLVDMPCSPGALAVALRQLVALARQPEAGAALRQLAERHALEQNFHDVLSLYRRLAGAREIDKPGRNV